MKMCPKNAETRDPDEILFSDLKPGDCAEIIGYRNNADMVYRSKLLAMGIVRGEKIKVLLVAPLGDPIVVAVMSYSLALRKSEAEILKIKLLLEN